MCVQKFCLFRNIVCIQATAEVTVEAIPSTVEDTVAIRAAGTVEGTRCTEEEDTVGCEKCLINNRSSQEDHQPRHLPRPAVGENDCPRC